tara:strand:+ start:876 stop:1112 length:237 start_codon:yes stop_codon:yes gene_type:complete
MMIDLLRDLIREEIKKLIQDDALFRRGELPGIVRHIDNPGIESEFDEPGDYDCPECEKRYPSRCPDHQVAYKIDTESY